VGVAWSWPYKPPPCQHGEVLNELKAIRAVLARIETREIKIMSDQAQLDADAQTIEVDVTEINTGLGQVQTALAALEQANPGLDFTAVNTALSDLGNSAAAVAAAGSSAPQPPASS